MKNLSTGDGGVVTTDNLDQARALQQLRWMGIDKDTHHRTSVSGYRRHDYAVKHLGYKAGMNDINAAIGLVQLEKLHDMQLNRRRIADWYRRRTGCSAASDAALQRPAQQPASLCGLCQAQRRTDHLPG